MDVFDFNIPDDNNNDIHNDTIQTEYIKSLNDTYENNLIDPNYYSYLLDWDKKQSICNLNGFINYINNYDNIDDFKKSMCNYYNKFLVFDDDNNKIRINKNICYYVSKVDTIDFTKEQKKGIKTLFDFSIDDNKTIFGFYGYAGSGKTTTIVEYLSYMIINKYMNSVAFVAPTHKALIVMRTKFKVHLKKISSIILNKILSETFNFDEELDILAEAGTTIKFMTIHSLLCFTQDYTLEGTRVFVKDKKKPSLISKFDFIVIDECSMIGIDMIDSILDETRLLSNLNTKYKKLPKIVFSGDPSQLPPVGEDESSVFCKNEKDLTFKKYLEIMKFNYNNNICSGIEDAMKVHYDNLIKDLGKMENLLLQTVVRSRIDNVTKVCNIMRSWIHTDDPPELRKYVGKVGVHFFDHNENPNKIKSKWFKKFMSNTKKNIVSIIVTWTNKQTDIYNETIRNELFKGQEILKYNKNDTLILGEFYSLDLGENFVKQKLHTSEQVKVCDVRRLKVPISTFELKMSNALKKIKNSSKLEKLINDLINGLNDEYCRNVDFSCWILKVKKSGLIDEDINHTMTLVVICDEEIEKYTQFKNETSIAIKNFSKKLLSSYSTTQIEKLVIKPLWKQWNKVFTDPFATVNYGYSITCHKAQGSSFHDVYVDLNDILKNQKKVEAKKCAYTSVTRTSNELNILL